MADIDVTGIDPWKLLAALHNASKIPPTWACSLQAAQAPTNTLTADQAKEEALSNIQEGYEFPSYLGGAPLWPDYLFGRPIKTLLVLIENRLFLTKANLYDHDIGTGAAQKVINDLLASGQHQDLRHEAWRP